MRHELDESESLDGCHGYHISTPYVHNYPVNEANFTAPQPRPPTTILNGVDGAYSSPSPCLYLSIVLRSSLLLPL